MIKHIIGYSVLAWLCLLLFILWVSDGTTYDPALGGTVAEWVGGVATAVALFFAAEQLRQDRLLRERNEKLKLASIFGTFLSGTAEFLNALETRALSASNNPSHDERVANAEATMNKAAADLRLSGIENVVSESKKVLIFAYQLRDTVDLPDYDREAADRQWAQLRDKAQNKMRKTLDLPAVSDPGWSIFDRDPQTSFSNQKDSGESATSTTTETRTQPNCTPETKD